MTKGNGASGVWTVTGVPSWKWQYYRYDVEVFAPSTGKVEHNLVTDPYSLALATNSARSQIVDLTDPTLAPNGWKSTAKPGLLRFEDLSVYELHVRDFSISDETVPAGHRGTYAAFTDTGSGGMKHLSALSKSGLRAVHLLPAFDIATIEERRSEQQTPACDLASYPPDSTEQQACVGAVRATDGFNWGYDPYHYTTPEGATRPTPRAPRAPASSAGWCRA
jgi:pullulanase/glycogen debranching enzyme